MFLTSASIPNSLHSFTELQSSAQCNNAFVGIQPQFRQTPPTLSFSTQATERPFFAQRMADT